MASKTEKSKNVLKDTFKEFSEDDCTSHAAAIAYFTVLALPPLLVIIITLAGFFLGERAVQGHLEQQISEFTSAEAAGQIQTIVRNASEQKQTGTIASIVSVILVLLAASGIFSRIQNALNRVWQVRPDPNQGGIKSFVKKRLNSFLMLLGVGVLLIASIVAGWALSFFAEQIANWLPEGFSQVFLWIVEIVVTLTIFMALFAAIFKILPDVELAWRDLWFGAFVTAVLFTIGKFAISFYLGKSDPGSAYGAAGSLVVLLIWIYYSALVFLIGAEFTQVWSRRYGAEIKPKAGAVRVVRELRPMGV